MKRSEHGQNLVETAITIPILLLFLLGILDLGRVFNNYMVLANATRQGAREAMRLSCWENTTGRDAYKTGIEDAVLAEIPAALQDAVYQGVVPVRSDIDITWGASQTPVTTSCPPPGETLRVALRFTFDAFVLADIPLSPWTEVRVYSRQPS